MAELRYLGSATWSRVIQKEDDTFSHLVAVERGDTVEIEDRVATRWVDETPRQNRVFVYAGSDEDPYKDEYEEEVLGGNATPAPKLDMGSTSPGGVPQFETADSKVESDKRTAKSASTRTAPSGNANADAAAKSQ